MAHHCRFVGLDVGKHTIDVHCLPDGRRWQVRNTSAALAELAATFDGEAVVAAVEPSGGYERPLMAACAAAGITLKRFDARRLRRFAQANGYAAKTDRLDARLLAEAVRAHACGYARLTQATPLPADSPARSELRELVTLRRQLCAQRAELKTRRQQLLAPAARAAIDTMIATFDTRITALERDIEACIVDDPELARRAAILDSVPGLGRVTRAVLLAEMPELGHARSRPLAALLGVAPLARESGQNQGRRHIAGGRARLRHSLYMTMLQAMRKIPELARLVERLSAQGKPWKVAMIACMRKFIVMLNALLRDNRTYEHRTA